MPDAALRACAMPRCPELVAKGYCRKCAAEREQQRPNVELRRFYRTARWARLRNVVLQEEPFCPECEAEGMVGATEDVHHKQKATSENFFVRDNLQAVCHRHHSRHTKRGE